MRNRTQKAEDDESHEFDPFAEPEPRPHPPRLAGGYRVSGDLEVRTKEIEQELVQTRARLCEMEREVYAARKVVRRRKASTAMSRGGIGATIMSVTAMIVCGLDVTTSPQFLLGLVVVGFIFGGLLGMRWDHEDDNFPPAPPPRMG